MNYPEKLTVKEAKEQGFEYYGYDSESWQSVKDIDEIEPHEFESNNVFLFDTETEVVLTNEQELAETIAGDIANSYYDQSGNEDEGEMEMVGDIEKILLESNVLKPVVGKINEKLSERKIYRLTKIRLVP